MSELTDTEREILGEVARRRPARPWGAQVSVALEHLAASGFITRTFAGSLTPEGEAELARETERQ